MYQSSVRTTLIISEQVSRLTTGPEIRGCRPVLVAFTHFKDREEVKRAGLLGSCFIPWLSNEQVLSKSKLLKSANIFVSEDLSRRTREQRAELTKHMRQVAQSAP